MTITNASQFPKTYYCRHMQTGIAKYENETILVDTDGMKSLIASASKKAIPVYINHQDVDLKNIKEQAAGYVSESFYNELDGWAWFKFIAVDDAAHDAIKKGWAVSNAYMPTEWGNAGTKNNCPYNREVRNGEFTHLAIVPDPRYEGACIMTPEEFKNYQDTNRQRNAELKNSKEKKPMFKLFKNTKEEVTGSEVDLDTHIELENGKSVSIRDMVATIENSKKEEQFVVVDGKKVTVKALAEAYVLANAKKTKKNTTDEEFDEDTQGDQEEEGDDQIGDDKKNKKMKKNKKEKKNADDDEDMENAEDDDKDEDDKKEKKNSKESEVEVNDKFFNELRNAHLKGVKTDSRQKVTISTDQLQRGKDRYGSGK